MKRSPSRLSRTARWMMVFAISGILPAVFMRCDKAALNFQRGLFTGLGVGVSQVLVDPLAP